MEEQQYGFVKEGKVFRNAFLDFGQREIGEVKDSEESTLTFFSERFNLAQAKVDQVEEKINATENKGSYLMKVLHLKDLRNYSTHRPLLTFTAYLTITTRTHRD